MGTFGGHTGHTDKTFERDRPANQQANILIGFASRVIFQDPRKQEPGPMAIIPASKKNAAWNVSKKLDGLLGWAIQPWSKPLPDGWADSYRETVRGAFVAAMRSFQADDATCQRLRFTLKMAERFIAVMWGNPTLSVLSVQDWNVPMYRQLFNDLVVLQREFEILGDDQTSVDTKPADEVPAAGAQHSKITVPTNEDVVRVVNLVARGRPVQTAAKEVAKNSEHSVGSLKTMYYAWKRNAKK